MEIEALAAIQALDFCWEIGIDSVILEDDLEIVIKSFRDEATSMSTFGHLIQKANFYVETFDHFVFSSRLARR